MINIINAIDYYPFGSTMPGRSFSTPSYRFGLNGMEKDDDLKGSGNSLDFGARIYDPRLGRWSARDKLSLKYVGLSPYTFVGNSPVLFIDPDGLQIVVPNINDRKAVLGAINKAFGEGFFTFDKSGKLNYSGKSTKELDPIQKKLFAYFSYINNNDIDTYIRLNTLHMKGKYSYNFSTEEVTFKHGNIYKLGSFGGMTGGVKYNTTDMGRTLQSAIASLYMESFVDIIITPTGMKGTTTNLEDGTQDEAGYDANIIMGVGEDESLEDGIVVTIVATGFTADQQGTITNTEVKKIVHTLEDEQKATYNFGEQKVQVAPAINEPLTVSTPAKVVHVLKEEVAAPKFNLIPTTEAIRNINVVCDEIAIETISEDDFIITNIAAERNVEKEVRQQPIQQDLLFDLPVNSYEEIKPKSPIVTTTNEIKNMNVVAEEVMPKGHQIEKRYVLDDFNVQPTIGKSSTPIIKEEVEEELQFQVRTKTQEEINNIETTSEEVSPLEITISELRKRTEERREKMKGFNHKFNDQVNRNIDDIERQPAYKRMGVDINAGADISKSDTALNADNNGLSRSNNSFLHDNVD